MGFYQKKHLVPNVTNSALIVTVVTVLIPVLSVTNWAVFALHVRSIRHKLAVFWLQDDRKPIDVPFLVILKKNIFFTNLAVFALHVPSVTNSAIW